MCFLFFLFVFCIFLSTKELNLSLSFFNIYFFLSFNTPTLTYKSILYSLIQLAYLSETIIILFSSFFSSCPNYICLFYLLVFPYPANFKNYTRNDQIFYLILPVASDLSPQKTTSFP